MAGDDLYTGNDEQETREPLTDIELQKIRNAIPSEPFAAYVVCLCYLGFRPGEMLALKKSDFNTEEMYVVGGSKTEAGRNRIVTIPPAIRQLMLDQLQTKGEYLFPSEQGTHMSDAYFRKQIFKPLMDRLGITGKVPYSCRHTYSNLIKNAPGDDGDKARLMGHTDYDFTRERYQSSSLEDLRKITDALK